MGQEYQVLNITELSRLSPAGTIDKYYRHKIQTRGGVILTHDIHERDFTPDRVEKILAEKAANADKILLSGQSPRT